MKKMAFPLLAVSLLAVISCDDSGTSSSFSSGGLPTGRWLVNGPNVDEEDDRYVLTNYHCYLSSGTSYMIKEELDSSSSPVMYTVSAYQGTYSVSGDDLTIVYNTRAKYEGETLPTSQSVFSSKALGTHDMENTAPFVVSGDSLVLGDVDDLIAFVPATTLPDYLGKFPCK